MILKDICLNRKLRQASSIVSQNRSLDVPCKTQNGEREIEVYSFSQISTSVSRATITTGTHDNEGYLDRNSNPDTTSLLPIIHSLDLSSARSRENPEPHKTTWEKASPQALRPSPPPHTAIVVIARLVFPNEVLSLYEGFTWDWRLYL